MKTQWIELWRLDKFKEKIKKWRYQKKYKSARKFQNNLLRIQPWEIKTSNPEDRVRGRENTVRRSNICLNGMQEREDRVEGRGNI